MTDRKGKIVNGAAAIIVSKDGRVLLTKRSREPYKGYWHLPGGGVEFGETRKETLIREIEEEVGVTIRILHGKADAITEDIIPEDGRHVICAHYFAEIISGTLIAGDGTEDFRWFTFDEADALLYLLRSTKWALQECLNWPI